MCGMANCGLQPTVKIYIGNVYTYISLQFTIMLYIITNIRSGWSYRPIPLQNKLICNIGHWGYHLQTLWKACLNSK